MTASTLAEQLIDALGSASFLGAAESELQAGVGELLERLECDFAAEVQLDQHSRIDFLAGTTGIEVKTQGSTLALGRQLTRYATSPRLSEILVITTKAAHRRELPTAIGGVPVAVVVVGGLG